MIKESFLHHVWKHKQFAYRSLYSTDNEVIRVQCPGVYNKDSGPDFFNARIKIGAQIWAGNVEIHIKASDWYAHGHEKDAAYGNVILHVVWEADIDVFGASNTPIPTLVLKDYITPMVLKRYKNLFSGGDKFIHCESNFRTVSVNTRKAWAEHLYINRLEKKAATVQQYMEKSANDWEAVLYTMLLTNFGVKINKDAFQALANSISFGVFRKLCSEQLVLEALLTGQAGLLENPKDAYTRELKTKYQYLVAKFNLEKAVIRPKFSKLRPANFPTLRLSQFASLYSKNPRLFSRIIKAKTINEYESVFSVTAASYWNDHYTFGKISHGKPKKLSRRFIHLLIINTLLPLKYSYSRYTGMDCNSEILESIHGIPAENNTIVNNYRKIGMEMPSALESQAALHAYTHFCKKHKCIECPIGTALISEENFF